MVRRPHVLGLREQGRRGHPVARQDLRHGREDHPGPGAHQKVVEVRNKQKRETEQKFFPGYVLVEMELTDDTWHLVRSTPKVTGFVGSGSKPVPLSQEQVDDIMRQMEAGAEKPKPKSVFQRGDKVRVVDGPFVNFQGVVEDMNPERGRMKVVVPVFGRPTSVELEYYQVERL